MTGVAQHARYPYAREPFRLRFEGLWEIEVVRSTGEACMHRSPYLPPCDVRKYCNPIVPTINPDTSSPYKQKPYAVGPNASIPMCIIKHKNYASARSASRLVVFPGYRPLGERRSVARARLAAARAAASYFSFAGSSPSCLMEAVPVGVSPVDDDDSLRPFPSPASQPRGSSYWPARARLRGR